MLSWSHINDERQGDAGGDGDAQEDGPREMDEAREARHNATYRQALILHGQGSPHSDEWIRAKHLYDNVLSDGGPSQQNVSSSAFKSPIRFLCLKNMADMFEREGDDGLALQGNIAAAEEDATDLAVWLKIARLARRAGLLNLARLALERLLANRGDHVLALRTLRDVLVEIGDGVALRQVSSRLNELDPYGAPYTLAPAPVHMPPTATLHTDDSMPQTQAISPVVERTLEFPSWERFGSLLLDIRDSVCGKITNHRVEVAASNTHLQEQQQEQHSECAPTDDAEQSSAGPQVSPQWQMTPSLSTPVRILLPEEYQDDDPRCTTSSIRSATGEETISGGLIEGTSRPADKPLNMSSPSLNAIDVVESAVDRDAPADVSGEVMIETSEQLGEDMSQDRDRRLQEQRREDRLYRKKQEQKRQQQLQRLWRRRRPAVLQAMEEFSDGSSTDDSEEEDGGGGGKQGKGKGKGGRWGKYKRGVERRTSGRLQKQDEMVREANVAAARENDMQFRLARLLFPGDEDITAENTKATSESGSDQAPSGNEAEDSISWWPHLASDDKGGQELGGRTGGANDADKEGTALADRVLPRWKKRHDEDCCRCGGTGMLVCCDFCHLVFHPKCLEVTPALSSLFACSDCKEEAANLSWELRTGDATTSFLEGGLQGLRTLLRAADGREGNAGVVDLMMRWLTAISESPAEELCSDRNFDGLDAVGVSRLATVALAIEPIVRGYLPVRTTWPPAARITRCDASFACTSTRTEGLELGLACELTLAEMHVDKVLAPTLLGRAGSTGADTPTTASSANSAPTPKTPTAGDKANAAPSSGTAVAIGTTGTVSTAALKTPGGAGAAGSSVNKLSSSGGAAGATQTSQNNNRASLEHGKHRKVATKRHLSMADSSMMQLEPFFRSWSDGGPGEAGGRQQHSKRVTDGSVGARAAATGGLPWAFIVRWCWLRGIRARHTGNVEEALICFRQCERALRTWDEEEGSSEEEKGEDVREGEKSPVVVLPYCVVNPRIDIKVVRGVIADIELSGTSEAARKVFQGAIKVLSAHASPTATEQTVTPSGGVDGSTCKEKGRTIADDVAVHEQSQANPEDISSSVKRGSAPEPSTGSSNRSDEKDPILSGERLKGNSTHVSFEGDQSRERASAAVACSADGAASATRMVAASADQPASLKVITGEPKVSRKDEAMVVLESLLRGLESRYVEQVSSITTTPTDATRAVDTDGMSTASNDRWKGVQGEAACWSIRFSPHRMEELLADLLEREKAFFSKVNKEGAEELEQILGSAAADSVSSSSAVNAPVQSATSVVDASTRAGLVRTAATVGESSKEERSSDKSTRAVAEPGHFPLPISGRGLGTHGSVFSMMLHSALVLGRYEMAVLIAIRCAEHMLDAAEMLSSPRGPLRVRRDVKELGMVALLLTSQVESAGVARRQLDMAATSACSEFLAHAVSVALWATPREIRAELFGGCKGSARRSSVLQCLSRIMRHSMKTDNVRALSLSVRGWQGVIAVAPSVALPPPLPHMEIDNGELEPAVDEASRSVCGGGGREPIAEALADPVRALVCCLCGVIVGRWKQTDAALKAGRTSKRTWELHAMEAVQFLTGVIQEYDAQAIPRFDGNDNAVANQDGGHGNNEGPSDISNEPVRRLFFSSPTELREIVDTLMGLSRIAQGNTAAQSCAGLYLVTSSSSPSSTTSKMGLRLACALAVLAIGMSGDMSQMDVSRKVGLLEALHDHLKGNGELPEGQPGRNGVCADGGGVFLKKALLYLASPEVSAAVEEERRIQRESGSGYSSDSSDGGNSDLGSGEDESDDADVTQDDADGDGQVDGNLSTLGERVVRAVAQCQSCLYDVAMVPCKNHRCVSTPSPPSTAAEAHALYKYWESRLPSLRRPRTVRLFEAVIANDAFASPPPTRFSKVVENYLFGTWGPRDGAECEAGLRSRAADDRAGLLREASGSGSGGQAVTEGEEKTSAAACSGDDQGRMLQPRSELSDGKKLPPYSCEGMNLQDVLTLLVSETQDGRQCSVARHRCVKEKNANGVDHVLIVETAARPTLASHAASTATASGGDTPLASSTPSENPERQEDGTSASTRHICGDKSGEAINISAQSPARHHAAPNCRPAEGNVAQVVQDLNAQSDKNSAVDRMGGPSTRSDAGQALGSEAKGLRTPDSSRQSTATDGNRGGGVGGGGGGGARGRELGLPPDVKAFSSVYLGLYRHMSEAKGVPSGFKYLLTKQAGDEVMSDMEAALTQGIRWRVFDLRVSPDRISSWKGLAQCAARLVAIYLDAFTPACHRLELPQAATVKPAATTVERPAHSNPEDCVDGLLPAEQHEKIQQNKLLTDSTRAASPAVGGVAVAPASAHSSYAANSDGMESGNITTGSDRKIPTTTSVRPAAVALPSIASNSDTASAMEIEGVAKAPGFVVAHTGGDLPADVDDGRSSHLCPGTTALPGSGSQGVSSSLVVQSETHTSADSSSSLRQLTTAANRVIEETSREPTGGATIPASLSASRKGIELTPGRDFTDAEMQHKPEEVDCSVVGAQPAATAANQIAGPLPRLERGAFEEISLNEHADNVLGLRATPGPDLSPFFNGTALDSHAARAGVVVRDGGWGAIGVGSRVASIAEGLRRAGTEGRARTEEEGATLMAVGARVLDGSATKEEWDACLGHASITAAATIAERSFAVWRTLAEARLARCRQSDSPQVVSGAKDEREEEAVVELAECCEEEAFMTYMIARDVWARDDDKDDKTTKVRTATSTDSTDNNSDLTNPAGPATTPAGLETGARRLLLDKSLALLRRARYLRTTDGQGSPSPRGGFSSPRSSRRRRRRRRRSSPDSSDVESRRERGRSGGGASSADISGHGGTIDKEKGKDSEEGGDLKRRKVESALPQDLQLTGLVLSPEKKIDGGCRAGEATQRDRRILDRRDGEGKGLAGRQGESEEDDPLPWQVPFVMGRLCARLGRHPMMVLDNLSHALRLAKDENVPLEDELEALCRLHSARAELILSGDNRDFLAVARLVEAHTFRDEDADTSTCTSSGNNSPIPPFGTSPPTQGGNTTQGLRSPIPRLGESFPLASSTVQAVQSSTSQATPNSVSSADRASPELLGAEAMMPEVSPVIGRASPPEDRSVVGSVDRSSDRSPVSKSTVGNVDVRRLAALENCLLAFESCLKKQKWQHTAIYAIANALLRGEGIATAARNSAGRAGRSKAKDRRSYGAKAARSMMSRLFEKRPQQLWLGISMADGMAGPGLAILGTRRRKLRALQKKYVGLYVDLLEATKGIYPLQNLQKRARASKDSREEVSWVQWRILRALIAVLRSEINALKVPSTHSKPQPQPQAASATTSAVSPSPPPPVPSASAGVEGGAPILTAAAASNLGAGTGGSTPLPQAPQALNATPTTQAPIQIGDGHVQSVEVNSVPGSVSNSAEKFAGAGGGGQPSGISRKPSPPAATFAAENLRDMGTQQPQPQASQQSQSQASGALTAGGTPAPVSGTSAAPTDPSNTPPEMTAPQGATVAPPLAAPTAVPPAATATGGGAVAQEKVILERAWDMYLKVLDLAGRKGALLNSSVLLRESEGVLVQAWGAFRVANPAVLDLVEMQNPPRVMEGVADGRGGGSGGGSRGTDMQRAQACCNALWPDRLGKGKMAKSKLRLKRPAAGQSQTGASRAAPKPRARPPGTSDKVDKPSSASATGATATGTRVEASVNVGTPIGGGKGTTGTAGTAATQSTPEALTHVPVETPLGVMPSDASSVLTSKVSAVSQSGGKPKTEGTDGAGANTASMPPKRSGAVSTALGVDTPQGGAASIPSKGSVPVSTAMEVDTPQGLLAPACEADATPEAMVMGVTSAGGTKSPMSQVANAPSAADVVTLEDLTASTIQGKPGMGDTDLAIDTATSLAAAAAADSGGTFGQQHERPTTPTITEPEGTRHPHPKPHTQTNTNGIEINDGDNLQEPMDTAESTGCVPTTACATARGRGEEMGNGDSDEPINVD